MLFAALRGLNGGFSLNVKKMKEKRTKMEQLRPLRDMIESDHLGDYLEIEQRLCHIIYQLHWLPWETFAGGPVRDNVWLLEKLRECFQQAREIQQDE